MPDFSNFNILPLLVILGFLVNFGLLHIISRMVSDRKRR